MVAERVLNARRKQIHRSGMCNAALDGEVMEAFCVLSPAAWTLLDQAMDRFVISARGHRRIRRVARTIADLADEEVISVAHLGEAIALRGLSQAAY